VIALFFLSQIHDSAALFGGRCIGGHKPFPSLSPNKTTAGYVSGAAGTCLGLGLLEWVMPALPRLTPLGFAAAILFVSITAGGGDLVFSGWKRATGVKDFSRLLGAHGGVLDRLGNICIMASVLRGADGLGFRLLFNGKPTP
jgi:phosphatidate cytidylyltransferase